MKHDDIVDALAYAYNWVNQHTHNVGNVGSAAQASGVGIPPNSIGYCPRCHELVPCWRKDWETPDGPECGMPITDKTHSWCANRLRPLTGCLGEHPAGKLIEAAFILGGTNAAVAVWRDHGHPVLASRFP